MKYHSSYMFNSVFSKYFGWVSSWIKSSSKDCW